MIECQRCGAEDISEIQDGDGLTFCVDCLYELEQTACHDCGNEMDDYFDLSSTTLWLESTIRLCYDCLEGYDDVEVPEKRTPICGHCGDLTAKTEIVTVETKNGDKMTISVCPACEDLISDEPTLAIERTVFQH